MLKNLLRKLAIGAIALTGVGLIYLLARTYFIKNNHIGVVIDYNAEEEKDRVRLLNPGMHILLSPFKSFQKEISTQDQIQKLNKFFVKTKDNVDTYIEADFTFRIDNPKASVVQVEGFQNALNETVKTAFSSAIQELNYQDVTSAAINEIALHGGHEEEQIKATNAQPPSMLARLPSKEHHLTGAEFFSKLINRLTSWGVTIINFRIVSVEAKHRSISEALELTAEADVRAKVQAKAAKSQADMIKTLAEAEKAAQETRANAALAAANVLKDSPVAQHIYLQSTQVQTAQALGKSGSNLVIGLGNNSMLENPLLTFSTTSKRTNNVIALASQDDDFEETNTATLAR